MTAASVYPYFAKYRFVTDVLRSSLGATDITITGETPWAASDAGSPGLNSLRCSGLSCHGTPTRMLYQTRDPIPLLQHPRDSHSSLHTIKCEEDCGTRPPVMVHVEDTTQQPPPRSALTSTTVLNHWTCASLATSRLLRRATFVHQSVPGNTICCTSWNPLRQRILLVDPIPESVFQLDS